MRAPLPTLLLALPFALPLAGQALGQAELIHLANEGFLIRSEEQSVLIDGFLAEPYVGYPALERDLLERMRAARAPFDAVDLALTSHVHRDHFQPALAAEFLAVSSETLLVGAPQVIEALVAAGVDPGRAHGYLPEGQQVLSETLGGVKVEAFRLSHGSGRFAAVQNLAHLFEVGGVRFLHVGDGVPDPEAYAAMDLPTRGVDVALVPYWYFDGGAAQQLIDDHIKPRHLIAMHLPLPEVDGLRKQLAGTDVAVMDRGESREYAPTVSFEVLQEVTPVLTNRAANPVARLRVRGPATVTGLVVSTGRPVRRLFLAPGTDKGTIDVERPGPWLSLTAEEGLGGPVREIELGCAPLELGPGLHFVWLLAGIDPTASLTDTFPIEVRALLTGDQPIEPRKARHAPSGLRPGVRVRHTGDDGSLGYRIPCLVRTNEGSLLAAYDVRREGQRDLQGDMDIGLSRSTDGGRTWEPMRLALDMGTWGGLPQKYNGVSDACLLVDRVTGRVFVFGCWMHGLRDGEGVFMEGLTAESTDWSHQWRPGKKGSGPGLDPRETAQLLMAFSDDDGRTWSEPVNLTEQVKDPAWFLAAPCPGNGITLEDGTLVIPAAGRGPDEGTFSSLLLSEDRGATWRFAAQAAGHDTTEAAVVQLADGSLMLNMRDNRNRRDKSDTNGRAVAVTADLGASWTVHPSDHRADLLPEPTCMASLLKLEGGALVFSNPNDRNSRRNMTLKASMNEGAGWPQAHQVVLDEVFGAYSSLAPVTDSSVGVLYESAQGLLVYQAVDLGELGVRTEGR